MKANHCRKRKEDGDKDKGGGKNTMKQAAKERTNSVAVRRG